MSATLSQSMGNSNGWRCQQLLCSSDGKRVVKVRAGFPARLACRLQNTWQPAHQRFPQSVTPTRSRLVWRQGGRHVHAPVPSCSLDVEVWRRRVFARRFFAGRRQRPLLCSRLSQPDTGHRDAQAPEPGGASGAAPFFSLLPNLNAAVVHAGRTIDGSLEWPQPRLFLMLSMLGSTPAGPGQVMDQRRMP